MRLPHRLGRELDAWHSDGLISEDQRRAILARYQPATDAEQVSHTLISLAILAAAAGVVVFLARNWAGIPPPVKTSGAIGSVIACYLAAAAAARAGKDAYAEWFAFLGALLSGGALYVGANVVHVDPERTNIPLLWSIVLASTAWLTPSALAAGAGTIVLIWWMVLGAPAPPVPWGFLLAWPMLAAAVERLENRFAAGAVAIAFGCWTFFVTLTVWGDAAGTPVAFVVALLAGAWLDALAHTKAYRPPAFARTTPALVVMLLALVFLLPSGSHRELHDWRQTTSSPWPVFALILSLAVMTVHLSTSLARWQWRPLVLALGSMAWLVAWLLTPVAYRASDVAQWTAIAAFSGATAWVGSVMVRDGSVTGDRTMVLFGVTATLALVVIRAVDTQGRPVVQAALLLALSALLVWLARRWSRDAWGSRQ